MSDIVTFAYIPSMVACGILDCILRVEISESFRVIPDLLRIVAGTALIRYECNVAPYFEVNVTGTFHVGCVAIYAQYCTAICAQYSRNIAQTGPLQYCTAMCAQ